MDLRRTGLTFGIRAILWLAVILIVHNHAHFTPSSSLLLHPSSTFIAREDRHFTSTIPNWFHRRPPPTSSLHLKSSVHKRHEAYSCLMCNSGIKHFNATASSTTSATTIGILRLHQCSTYEAKDDFPSTAATSSTSLQRCIQQLHRRTLWYTTPPLRCVAPLPPERLAFPLSLALQPGSWPTSALRADWRRSDEQPPQDSCSLSSIEYQSSCPLSGSEYQRSCPLSGIELLQTALVRFGSLPHNRIKTLRTVQYSFVSTQRHRVSRLLSTQRHEATTPETSPDRLASHCYIE